MSTNRSYWSRPRGPLLLGAAACAACCATPIAAVVIGAGAASTLAAIAEPIAGLLLATAAILTISIVVRRCRARAAEACATDGSCGCGPSTKFDVLDRLASLAFDRGDCPRSPSPMGGHHTRGSNRQRTRRP